LEEVHGALQSTGWFYSCWYSCHKGASTGYQVFFLKRFSMLQKNIIEIFFLEIFLEHGVKCAIFVNSFTPRRFELKDLYIWQISSKNKWHQVHGNDGTVRGLRTYSNFCFVSCGIMNPSIRTYNASIPCFKAVQALENAYFTIVFFFFRRENPHRPFRCLDCQYRRELVRVYLTNVEGICRRFVEEKKEKLGKLMENTAQWNR